MLRKLMSLLLFALLCVSTAQAQVVGTVTIDRARVGAREIFLMRGNAIVGTYGGQSSSDDLGDALVTAVAAAQDGDVLVTGSGVFNVELLEIAVRLEWLGFGTVLGPLDADWSSIVSVGTVASPNSGDDTVIRGVKIDGRNETNAGSGNGFLIRADRVSLIDCEASNCEGGSTVEGRGVYTVGDDTLIDGLYCEDNSYVGIRASNANRLIIRNTRLWNIGNTAATARSIAIDGTSPDLDWIHFENIDCYANETTTRAYIGFNSDSTIGHVSWDNVRITNEDNISAGVSFNTASREQSCKWQSIDLLTVKDCVFMHGRNSGAGDAVGFSFDAPFPEHSRFTGCTFAMGIWNMGSARVETMAFTDCHFGYTDADEAVLSQGLGGGKIGFYRCKMNLHDGVRAFTISSASPAAEDYIHIVDCVFLGDDDASDLYVMQNLTNDLLSDPRRVICTGNTLTNNGTQDFFLANDTEIELLLTTDRNGTIMHDDSDARVTDPGAGPNFFSGLPGVFQGQRIINEEWNGSGIQYYFYNGTNWVDGTD